LGGLTLRIASYTWNSRLYGDVNLFALTAREFVLHGKLQYPMKYEYSDNVPYLALTTPASQHPPLWPLMGGILARLAGTDDTFSALKIATILAGMVLIVVVLLGMRHKWNREALVAGCLVAISPLLVDFSANGSMYILSAVLIVLASILMLNFQPVQARYALLAGILCGAGFLVHSSLLLLPVAFLLYILFPRSFALQTDPQKTSIGRNLVVFLLAFLITLSPWLVWNYLNFGKPLYSYSSFYLPEQLGLLQSGIYNGVITQLPSRSITMSTVLTYLLIASKACLAFIREFAWVTGPFTLLLLIAGIDWLYRYERRWLYALLLPSFFYTLAILAWATYKFRFLVPLLAPTYLLAAFGFVVLVKSRGWRKWLAWLLLLGSLVWMAPFYFLPGNALYYGNETPVNTSLYDQMHTLALELKKLEPGVVLGYSQSLDGGIETVYWDRFPFVAGRGLDTPAIQKLANDFRVRYIWCDDQTRTIVEGSFSNAHLLLEHTPYSVYELDQ
jgi:hypothetical protein